jgi:aryl-alcohol dehydrogenase-like predicted oxidoreductase
MKQVNFAATGEKVSEFCLGAMLMGTAVDKATTFQILDHFTSEGGNFIDTANCYTWWLGTGEYIGGESETYLGLWMKERKNRDKIFIATKVGAGLKDPTIIRDSNGVVKWDKVRGEYEGLSRAVIKREVENSLLRLKTDYIDLYYTHVYDPITPVEETMEALNELIKEGKVRYLGASNLTTEQLKNANNLALSNGLTPYVALQQEYSYIHPKEGADTGITSHANKEMFDYVTEKSMAFMAYSPLLKGIYTNKEKRYQYYNWNLYDSEENVRKLTMIEEQANKVNITGNQLVLAWMLRQNPQIIPILGFSRLEQYLENIKTITIGLPQEVLELLNK